MTGMDIPAVAADVLLPAAGRSEEPALPYFFLKPGDKHHKQRAPQEAQQQQQQQQQQQGGPGK
jgi:hypothetical protein